MSTTSATAGRPNAVAEPEDQAPGRASSGAGLGFWLVAGAFLIAMAFSTVPTPLYPIYAQDDEFSSLTITLIFAVYAIGVVASLLLVGHVSDWVGRKRMLVSAMVLEAVAGVLFIASHDLVTLITARLITGLGVGAVTATATAYLAELHAAHRPTSGKGRFEVISGAANIGGLGFGPLVTGALAQYVRAPLVTPFVVFIVGLLVFGALVVALSPETVLVPRSRWPRYRPQRLSTGESKTSWAASAGSAFSAFAIFGLFTSLAPEFVADTLHHPSRFLAGIVVFLAFGVAPLAQTLTTRLSARTQFGLGVAGEALGLVLLAVGMESANLVLFLVAAATSGAGAGVLFRTAIGRTIRLAPAPSRGEALAGLFLVAYGGLIIPAVGVGVATQYVAPQTAMLWFAAVIIVVLALVSLATLHANRSGSVTRPARA